MLDKVKDIMRTFYRAFQPTQVTPQLPVPAIYMCHTGVEYPATVVEIDTMKDALDRPIEMARIFYLARRDDGTLLQMTAWVVVSDLDEIVTA